MATNPFSLPDAALDAFSGLEHHFGGHYPDNAPSSLSDSVDMNAPIPLRPNNNMDSTFFPDLSGAPNTLFDPYGGIDWSMYQYHNPFAPSPAPALDHDTMSSVGTVDDPELLSPTSDTTFVDPSTLSSNFKLPSPYDFDDTHSFGHSLDPSLSAASPASDLSSPDPSCLYDPFFGYGHPSQFALGTATDVSSPPPQPAQDVGVDVSAGEVPLTFTQPQTLVIADLEDPPAAPQAAQTTSSTSGRTTRRNAKQARVSPVDGGNEDSDSEDKRVKRGRPEYRCKYCPSGMSLTRSLFCAHTH